MKKLKDYIVLIVVAAILLVALFTNQIASCSADESVSNETEIQNLLTIQKDSIESFYLNKIVEMIDSSEKQKLIEIEHLNSEKKDLSATIANEKTKYRILVQKYNQSPDLENCSNLVIQQENIIENQNKAINNLDLEVNKWCELYDKSKEKENLLDSLISNKNSTIEVQKIQIKNINTELSKIRNKIDNSKWLKRNFLWATGSYRNWVVNTR